MKDRFWTAYFYVMWLLVISGLFVFGKEVFGYLYRPQMELGIYLIISGIVMTIIRWIATGKHFWNKP